jgi:hypothetical protein
LSEFRREEYKALHENSALDIFNDLREMESDRLTHQRRWPWELLQNAVDEAKESGVDCVFALSASELIFTHNGNPFTMKNVAHLILHGSTKASEGKKIRFGTGFLTTHLLSRTVQVSGSLDDGRRFNFQLSREAQNWSELEKMMNKASRDFEDSLGSKGEDKDDNLSVYQYPLSGQGRDAATSGLNALNDNAPIVLALNAKLHSIKIIDDNLERIWIRNSEQELSERLNLVEVQCLTGGVIDSFYVALSSEDSVTVAVLLEGKAPSFGLASMERIPKLYYEFPLALTEGFPIPAVIVCPNFIPRTERDGLLLGEDPTNKSNQYNKSLIAVGSKLFLVLARFSSKQGWANLYRLAQIKNDFAKQWLDSGWMNSVCLGLIAELQKLAIVQIETEDNSQVKHLTPTETTFPYDSDYKRMSELWDLANGLYPHKIPQKRLSSKWCDILSAWSEYIGKPAEEIEQVLTLAKLAKVVSCMGSLEGLASRLTKQEDTIGWFNKFVEFVAASEPTLIQSLPLIPDQSKIGAFKNHDIHRDLGIDETLKEIMSKLGKDIRPILCDARVTKAIQSNLTDYDQDRVVRDAINVIKLKSNSPKDYGSVEYEQANVALFQWLTVNQRYADLSDNFPLLNSKRDQAQSECISRLVTGQAFLQPVSLWDLQAKRHSTVFPDERIMSEAYTRQVLTIQPMLKETDWAELANHNLILRSLFITEEEELDEAKIRHLLAEGLLDSEERHGTKDTIKLTSIAYIDMKDRGINYARKTKQGTKSFLDFFLSYVAQKDDSWLKPIVINCSCKNGTGKHSIYPSRWLFLLRSRQWVYVGKDDDDYPKPENLAPFFQSSPELLKLLQEDLPARLLSSIGVSPVQVMLASESATRKADAYNAFARLLLATNSDVDELNRISEVYKNPALRSRLNDAYQLQHNIKRNQRIGKYVEDTIRDLLGQNLCEKEFKVAKVPQEVGGSDVLVEIDGEYEFLDDDLTPLALRLEIAGASLRIEVKSTKTDYVRMTPKQVKDAIAKPELHFVCVVEVPRDFDSLNEPDAIAVVKNNSRFLTNVGPKLMSHFQKAEEVRTLEDDIRDAKLEDVMIELVRVSEVRVRLNRNFWTTGVVGTETFDEFINHLTNLRNTRLIKLSGTGKSKVKNVG